MRALLFLASLVVAAVPAVAQTCTTSWTNPAGGDWETGTNWSDGVPDGSDTACITLDGTYTVTLGTGLASVAALTVGGASGIQTFNTAAQLSVGSAVVRPTGRMELLNLAGGGADGLYASGTVTVEGTAVVPAGVSFLTTGGLLDVAPGGTLSVVGNGVDAGAAAVTFRIRGLLEASGCPETTSVGSCSVSARLDVQGGTVRAAGGVLFVRGGGTLASATLDAAAGASLYLNGSAAASFTVSGTLSGAPAGDVYATGGTFAAAAGDATLAVGGTGLLLGGSVHLTSAGGTFLNSGVLTHAATGSNFAALDGTTLRNTGRFVMPGVGFGFQNDGVVRNEASGTIEIANGGGLAGVGGSDGRVENAGLILANGSPVGPGSGATAGSIGVPYDGLPGSTIRVATGRLDLTRGGFFRDTAFDVPAGAALLIAGNVDYVVSGTLSGTPAGDLFASGSRLAAGPGGATLNVGGTGLQLSGGALLTSAGGAFLNTALLRKADTASNFAGFRAVVVTNRAIVDITSFRLLDGAVLRNEPGATVLLRAGGSLTGDGRLDNAGLILRQGNQAGVGGTYSFSGLLRSLPGSEIRSDEDRVDLDAPGSRSVPDGTTLTGTGRFGIGRDLDFQGTISPGTDSQPLAKLAFQSAYIPSSVAGSPKLVIEIDAGGRSDTLDVLFSSGAVNVRLAGALVVRVRPGYTPAIGDLFTVLTSARDITGQFGQVVAAGAPNGIAFVTELSSNLQTLLVRAVETAPGGPISVSTTTPVNGNVRSIFLTGPGAVGISGARLECTTCLDPTSYGLIQGTLVGSGALVEARFDLTSSRAFGLYDLVITRPGLDDIRMPETVRPYVSYVRSLPALVRGMRVRPPGTGYNWSDYQLTNATNADEPAYPFTLVAPEDPGLVAFAVATGTPFSSGTVFYESETATEPTAPAFLFSRINANETAALSTGQRIAPENVLFPEQTPTGPTDPRLRFGAERVLAVTSLQHVSFGRAVETIELALRSMPGAGLPAYLAQVDAADSAAVRRGISDALATRPRYVAGIPSLLTGVLAQLNATVTTPPGLPTEAAPGFQRFLELASYRLYADVEHAYRIDLANAPPSVRALLQAEYDDLISGASAAAVETADAQIPLGSVCRNLNNLMNNLPPSGPPPPPTAVDIDQVIQCQVQAENSPPLPTDIDINTIPQPLNPITEIVKSVNDISRRVINNMRDRSPYGGNPFAGLASGGSCGGGGAGGGGGGGGGAGGAGACGPPQAPADPNDKIADATLRCEFGTVVVDGETQTRCLRYFIPLVSAAVPVRYSIQFENLPQATANAEFVTVTDTLDANLNPATLRVLATSSDSSFTYTVSGSVVTFRFVGIDLPPNIEEPEGQGFVTFDVSPNANLPEGTVIENRASIVFDFNPPIATPVVVHEIRAVSDVAATIAAPNITEIGAPLAFSVSVANIDGDPAADVDVIISTSGLVVTATPTAGTCTGSGPVTCTLGTLGGASFERINLVATAPSVGVYTITSSASTTSFDGFAANDIDMVSIAVTPVDGEVGPDDLRVVTLAAPRPNPARGAVTLRWGLPQAGEADVRIFDLLGREVARVVEPGLADAGWHESRWAADVASGVYVVRLEAGNEVRTRRLIVVR